MLEVSNKSSNNSQYFFDSPVHQRDDRSFSETSDITPFGLNLQEDFPNHQDPKTGKNITMGQCPTCVMGSSDSSIDVDYEF